MTVIMYILYQVRNIVVILLAFVDPLRGWS